MAATKAAGRAAAEIDAMVFAVLNDAAESGRACPLKTDTARIVGCSVKTVRLSMERLSAAGKIRRRVTGNRVTVIICATGKCALPSRPSAAEIEGRVTKCPAEWPADYSAMNIEPRWVLA